MKVILRVALSEDFLFPLSFGWIKREKMAERESGYKEH